MFRSVRRRQGFCYPDVSAGHDPGPPSNVFHEDVHGRSIHMVTRRPLYPKGVQRVPLVLHTRCSQMGLEVRGHLRRRQRQVTLDFVFEDARGK